MILIKYSVRNYSCNYQKHFIIIINICFMFHLHTASILHVTRNIKNSIRNIAAAESSSLRNDVEYEYHLFISSFFLIKSLKCVMREREKKRDREKERERRAELLAPYLGNRLYCSRETEKIPDGF